MSAKKPSRNADMPKINLRKYRACLRCRRLQTEREFSDEGCANCRTKLSSSTPTFYGYVRQRGI